MNAVSPTWAVEVRGLGMRYGSHTVLDDVDLEVAPGSIVALLGVIAIVVIVWWTLVAGRLSRLQISGAIVMVVAGIVIGLTTNNSIGNALDTDAPR